MLESGTGSAYGNVVLERLCGTACRILGVEQTCLLVRDRRDPRMLVAVAARGMAPDVIGSRFAADEGAVGRALGSGRTVPLESVEAVGPLSGGGRAGAAAPIRGEDRTRGVLWVASCAGRRLDARDRTLLSELSGLAAAALENVDAHLRLDEDVDSRVDALAGAMALRDGYTGRHSDEVVALAREVGRRLGLDEAAIVELSYAARLHDVGKLNVPDDILRKPGPLEGPELRAMQDHAVSGAEMLSRIPGLQVVATIVRFHHERWDGRGYPEGLRDERIPMASRIIAACDAFRAMTTDRPYRMRIPVPNALDELHREAGAQFDPKVVHAVSEAVATSLVPVGAAP